MCEYCEGNSSAYGGFMVNDQEVIRLFSQDGDYEFCEGAIIGNVLRVYVSGDDYSIGDHPINFCPMCGRDLKESE